MGYISKKRIALLYICLLSVVLWAGEGEAAAKKKTDLSLRTSRYLIRKGESYSLDYRVTPKKDKNKIVWKSDHPGIVSVNKKGVVKGLKKRGSAKITGRLGKKKVVCKITVGIPVKSIEVGSIMEIPVGEEQALACTVSPENATDASLSYHIENEAVATIDKDGIIRALDTGETLLTITAEDRGKVKEIVSINVTKESFHLGEKIQDLGEEVGKGVQGLGEEVGKGVRGLGESIRDLGHGIGRFVYGNSVFNGIWGYLLGLLTGFGVFILLRKVVTGRKSLPALSAVSAVLLLAGAGYGIAAQSLALPSLAAIVLWLVNGLMAWCIPPLAGKIIGDTEEVECRDREICSLHMAAGILALLALTGFPLCLVNRFLGTAIPENGIYLLLLLAADILFATGVLMPVFCPYRNMVTYIRKNKYFTLRDITDAKGMDRLRDKPRYVSAVLEKSSLDHKCYETPFQKDAYWNAATYQYLVDAIRNNTSSAVIRENLAVDWKDISFESVYEAMFQSVKGYSIAFEESREAGEYAGDDREAGAALRRYSLNDHPMKLEEEDALKARYVAALDLIADVRGANAVPWQAKLGQYAQEFGIPPVEQAKKEEDVLAFAYGKSEDYRKDYSYLLLFEGLYFRYVCSGRKLSYREIETLFDQLTIPTSHRDFVYKYIDTMFVNRRADTAQLLMTNNLNSRLYNVLDYVHQNII